MTFCEGEERAKFTQKAINSVSKSVRSLELQRAQSTTSWDKGKDQLTRRSLHETTFHSGKIKIWGKEKKREVSRKVNLT